MSRNVVFAISMRSAPPWNPFESHTPRISPLAKHDPRGRLHDLEPALPRRVSGPVTEAVHDDVVEGVVGPADEERVVEQRVGALPFGLVVAVLDEEMAERLVRAADHDLSQRRPPRPGALDRETLPRGEGRRRDTCRRPRARGRLPLPRLRPTHRRACLRGEVRTGLRRFAGMTRRQGRPRRSQRRAPASFRRRSPHHPTAPRTTTKRTTPPSVPPTERSNQRQAPATASLRR